MDDETENERLLREIKFLTDLISSAKKQKETVHINNSPSSQTTPFGDSSQRDFCHRQYEGNSTFNYTNSLPPYLRQKRHPQEGEKHHALDSSYAQDIKSTKQLFVSSQSAFSKSNTNQKVESGKLTRTLSASVPKSKFEITNTDSFCGTRVVLTSKSVVPLCSSGQRVQASNKTAIQTKHPSHIDRQSNSSSGDTDAVVRTLSAKAQFSQLQRNQLVALKRGLQRKHVSVGLSSHSLHSGSKEPVHPVRVPASAHSTHKEQLVLKTAEVMNKLSALKSTLAKVAAAKKKKNCKVAHKSNSSETKPQSELCNTKPKNGRQITASDKMKEENEATKSSDRKVSVTVSSSYQWTSKQTSDVKTERSVSSPSFTVLKCFNKPLIENSHSRKPHHAMNKLAHSSPGVQLRGQPVAVAHSVPTPSASSKPSTYTPSIAAEIEGGVFMAEKDKANGSSPSKSSARASLERELKATEAKLVSMRKKMGVMLRESPTKTSEYKKRAAVPSQRNKVDLVNLSVKAAMHGCVAKGDKVTVSQDLTCGSPSASGAAKQRPFPNRKSLKWTPQKSPAQKSSERVLVVGSSPSLRSYLNTSSKAGSSTLNCSEAKRNHSVHTHTTANRSTLSGKKSRYSLVKTPGITATSKLRESTSQTAVSTTPKRLHGRDLKPFVGRYKLQRLNSESPKTSKSGRNLQGKVLVKSRYKLTKLHSQPYFSGYSTHQTAMFRAAKVIKSKYKMRKVPIPISPFGSSASLRQKEQSENHYVLARNFQSAQPFAWGMKAGRYNRPSFSSTSASRYSFQTSSFLPLRNPSRGRHRQGRNNAGYFYGGSWDSSSKWWWTQQYQGKHFTYQQSLRCRAKAIMAWKAQQRSHPGLTQFPYSQWPVKVHCGNRDQQQKRLLLKRLQWMRKYHLSRKQTSRRDTSPRKTQFQGQKQEHLVMINGILYKSSSSRLTKAYSSSSISHPSKPGTSSSAASVASTSRAKLNSSIVVRNVKQCKMQTVTVRGISFKMDSRGTKLQRVQSSVTYPDKLAAISRVDVGGTTYLQTKDGVLEKISDSQTRSVVNRVKQRSIALAAAKFKKDNTKGRKKNCLFFSRFGKCSRGVNCPFLHDPEKIAVCTRFLRGTCKVENCPFSHKVSKEKMPVCAFFLRGVCTRQDCPYLHVKVSQGAEVCQDFVTGFCPLADKCHKLHTLTCPQFAKTGVCSDGKKCRMLHRKLKAPRKLRAKSSASSTHEESGSKVSHQGTKRPARLYDTADHQAEGSLSQRKRFKPDTDTAQRTPGDDSTLQEPAVSDATPDPEGSAPPQSAAKSNIATEFMESYEECKDSPPAKLPAFISLADYSLEESPSPRAPAVKFPKRSMLDRGISLRIKPRI